MQIYILFATKPSNARFALDKCKNKREADSLRSPLMIYYNYVLCLLYRNPTWVTEILVSSVLYGEIAVLCGWVDPKLS